MSLLKIIPFLILGTIGPLAAQQTTDSIAPESTTDHNRTDAHFPVRSQNWMISAANPLATKAGAKILANGGTAADAMIAVQLVLGLVEPQSSGLGGGAFLVWYDAETQKITTLDGRETAPLDVTPRQFQDDSGAALKFFDAVVGGLSVGVPGTPMLLQEAHNRWGRTNWPVLFRDAISHAESGFSVSPRLANLVARDTERLARSPATAAYFFPNGSAIAAGDTLKNPAYANTLRGLALLGTKSFYTGPIAEDIVTTIENHRNPGTLSLLDLTIYRAIERPAICAKYRDHDICGMGPPSSGALTVGQILGILDHYDLRKLGPQNPESWRLIGDASRLAFADRGRYMADSDYVPMPTKGLLDPAYLAKRAALLDRKTALETADPGSPDWDHAQLWADDEAIEFPSTSHISIVDSFGNALSMTSTIENAFGSRLMTNGFLLNNELTDFSFRTHRDGRPIANRIEPGKRPRSSMAPTIVLKDGAPILVTGSPGGSRIIGYVAQSIIAHLDWDMNVQAAAAMPHLVNRFGTYDVEIDSPLIPALGAMGFKVKQRDLNSGLHMISVGETLEGGADPRREGRAIGG